MRQARKKYSHKAVMKEFVELHGYRYPTRTYRQLLTKPVKEGEMTPMMLVFQGIVTLKELMDFEARKRAEHFLDEPMSDPAQAARLLIHELNVQRRRQLWN